MASLAGAEPPAIDNFTDRWPALLGWITGIVAVVDVVVVLLIGEAIPPLVVGAVLTAVGLVLLRTRRRLAVGLLGVVSVLMLLAGVPFAADHLAHPESGVDFTHAVVGVFGRLAAIAVAVAAWRRVGSDNAGRARVVLGGALAVVVLIAAVATLAGGEQTAAADDVVVDVEGAEFPEEVRVPAGGTVFADNHDLFRHTFTVEGEDVDVELPAGEGRRIELALPAGSYELLCTVPGHERMKATLVVE